MTHAKKQTYTQLFSQLVPLCANEFSHSQLYEPQFSWQVAPFWHGLDEQEGWQSITMSGTLKCPKERHKETFSMASLNARIAKSFKVEKWYTYCISTNLRQPCCLKPLFGLNVVLLEPARNICRRGLPAVQQRQHSDLAEAPRKPHI